MHISSHIEPPSFSFSYFLFVKRVRREIRSGPMGLVIENNRN
jgi:hypothetical protein